MHFDKITARISKLCYGLDPAKVQAVLVAQKVCAGVYPDVTTSELDDLAAETAAYMSTGDSTRRRRVCCCPPRCPSRLFALPAASPLRNSSWSGLLSRAPRALQTTRSTRCWRPASRCPTCTR